MLSKSMSIKKQSQGFTLIELIVVVGIIAVLAAFVFALLNPLSQFQKADDGKRKFDLSQIQRAMEQYYQDYSRYPNVDTSSYQMKDSAGTIIQWGKTTSLWQRYMSILPADPLSPSRKYVYYVSSDGQSYWLYAALERGTLDSDICTSGGKGVCSSLSTNSIPTTSCGTTCNFGVSSPNVAP